MFRKQSTINYLRRKIQYYELLMTDKQLSQARELIERDIHMEDDDSGREEENRVASLKTAVLALALILGLCNHALCTELWIIKDNDCVPCRKFRDNVYPVYLQAEERNRRLPALVVKDVDRDRYEVMNPRIKRFWFGTPAFLLVEDDGRVRAIHPDFYSPMGFIEDVMQEVD